MENSTRFIIKNLPAAMLKLTLSIIIAFLILSALIYLSIILPNIFYSIKSLRIESIFGLTILALFTIIAVAAAFIESIYTEIKNSNSTF